MRIVAMIVLCCASLWAAPVSLLIMDEYLQPVINTEVGLSIGENRVRFPSDAKGVVHLFKQLPQGTALAVHVSGFATKRFSLRCPLGLPDCVIPVILQVAQIGDESIEIPPRRLKVSKTWLDRDPRWVILVGLAGDRSVVYVKESFGSMKVPGSWGGNFMAYALFEDGTTASCMVFINHYERKFLIGPKT